MIKLNIVAMNTLRVFLFIGVLILCLLVPAQAEDTSYIYSFDSQTVPNATISLLKQNGNLYNSWTTDEIGSYDLDQIKSYLQARWSSIPNGYIFYIQVEKLPHFDRTWKLQRIDATHIKVNDGNTYTTSTVWTYLKNNLRLTEPAGLGHASRTGVTVSNTDLGVRVDGSGDDAMVFIPGNLHYRYTVQHVNDTGNITDEFVVYPQLIGDDWYVVFDADKWSYYTVDGSLISVGITDMRLNGNTVEITGDGYDRLALQADYANYKLYTWNQQIVNSRSGRLWHSPEAATSDRYKVATIYKNLGTSVIFHAATLYTYVGFSISSLNNPQHIGYCWLHDTTNNYYSYQFYIDSDHNAAQDVVIETFTPDNIDYFIVEMWNGTAGAYQEVLNDSTYTAANLINLNNSSTGLDFAFYEGGKRGETVSVLYGNISKPDKTISAYYGCEERRLILFTLPADDGADSATSGASQVKLRLTVYYNPEGIVDNSNYTNHGTQHGGVSRVRDGQIGETIGFDGVNDYIDCDDESSNITDEISMETWFKYNILASTAIIGKGDPLNYYIGTGSAGRKLRFKHGVLTFDSTLYHGYNVEEWHHIIVTVKESTNEIIFYSDGVKLGNTVTLTGSLTNNSNPLEIGIISAYADKTSCEIDELRIYTRILNATEAAEHYNGTFNNETGLVFHSPMELTPSGAATYEFEDSANQYYGLDNINGDTMMLYKAGTQNVTYLTYDNLTYDITAMTIRADENELIDRWYITYNTTPESQEGNIINQSAIDVDTDSDGDNVPDAFEDANITVNKGQQGGELKWNYVWEGAFNIVNSTGYIYYTNLINGSGLVGTEIQTAGTQNMSMNTAGAGETYNFTVNSGMVDWLNVTSGLISGSNYSIYNGTTIESQLSDGSVNFTTDLSVGTYSILLDLLPPQNLTNITEQTQICFDWDDYASADKWNISQRIPSIPYIDVVIVLDGVKDAEFANRAHTWILDSPNPTGTNGDKESISWIRNSTTLSGYADGEDDDALINDDSFKIMLDMTANNLTTDDRQFILSESGTVTAKRWSGAAWLPQATNAVGVVIGAGVAGDIQYEMQIPISELTNFNNGSTIKLAMAREDTSQNPDVIKYFPKTLINDTDATIWTSIILSAECEYTFLGNTTLSNYTVTGLTPFTWYRHRFSTINGSTESSYVYSNDITEDSPQYTVSGYILTELGTPISGAAVWSVCDCGCVCEVNTSNATGYYQGDCFYNGTYTIYASKTDYDTNSTSIVVNGTNQSNQNITLISSVLSQVPLSIFMGIGGMILIMFISSLVYVGIPAIFTSFLGTMLAFINSAFSVNGQLVQNISGIDSAGNVVQGTTVIEVPALCYLFIFIGLIMAGLTIYHIAKEFQYKNEKEYVEVDF